MSAEPKPAFDVFSYHYYGAVSKRCIPGGPGSTSAAAALTPEWLGKTEKALSFYQGLRDKYLPGRPIWNTETADAGCGGNPWGATFLDCFRYVEQLGRLAKNNVQVVIHNTFSASEYGLVDQDTHIPRPNYWAALLWSKFMGQTVYDAGLTPSGIDVFIHSLKNEPGGFAVLVVNTLETTAAVKIPAKAAAYILAAESLQTKKIQLNGTDLTLTVNNELPLIKGKQIQAGEMQLPAHSITFLTFTASKK